MKRPALFIPIALFAFSCLAQNEHVSVDGASALLPLTTRVVQEHQRGQKTPLPISVDVSGAALGFAKFCAGAVDIAAADRPILESEAAACAKQKVSYIELPVAQDALVFVIHPRNTFLRSLSLDEIKKIWEPAAQGKITKWNQINSAYPDAPLRLLSAGKISGEQQYLTAAVMGVPGAERGDYMVTEDAEGVVRGVSRDLFTLGLLDFGHYANNRQKLRAVPIVLKPGSAPVTPTAEALRRGTYEPLQRPLLLYVNAKSAERLEVKAFIETYLTTTPKLASQVNVVALTEAEYGQARLRFNTRTVGSSFNGRVEIGVTAAEMLKRQPKL